MDRTERFYHIDRLLNERQVVPVQAFLDELEVLLATFKRDQEYLRERFNAPIVWYRDAGGLPVRCACLRPRYELLGLLSAHVEPLLTRLRAILGEGELPVEDIDKSIRFHRQAGRTHDSRHFGPIATEVLQRRRLTIDLDKTTTPCSVIFKADYQHLMQTKRNGKSDCGSKKLEPGSCTRSLREL